MKNTLPSPPRNRVVLGLILGFLFAFTLYQFILWIHITSGFFAYYNPFTFRYISNEDWFYLRWFIALISGIFGLNTALFIIFSQAAIPSPKFRRRQSNITIDQFTVSYSYLFWHLKMISMVGAFVGGSFWINEYRMFIQQYHLALLIIVVLFLNAWISLRRIYRFKAFIWMGLSALILLPYSLILTQIEFFEFRKAEQLFVDNSKARSINAIYPPILNAPEHDTTLFHQNNVYVVEIGDTFLFYNQNRDILSFANTDFASSPYPVAFWLPRDIDPNKFNRIAFPLFSTYTHNSYITIKRKWYDDSYLGVKLPVLNIPYFYGNNQLSFLDSASLSRKMHSLQRNQLRIFNEIVSLSELQEFIEYYDSVPQTIFAFYDSKTLYSMDDFIKLQLEVDRVDQIIQSKNPTYTLCIRLIDLHWVNQAIDRHIPPPPKFANFKIPLNH